MSIIYQNNKRNIYDDNGRINYYNYKNILYDFDNIEKTIYNILFSGKKKVKFNDKLYFVTYYLETFRGDNSNILSDFIEKYPPKKISQNEISEFIENDTDNQFKIVIKLLSIFQYLFYYFTTTTKINRKISINERIKRIPYFKESMLCQSFFEKIALNINELFEAYSYIEKLVFNHICKFLNVGIYNDCIDEIKIKNIKNLFREKKIKSFNKRDFVDACRKLIARYLIGIRNDIDINEKNKLHLYLNRRDLWPLDKWKNGIEKDLELIGKEEILVSQCYSLYKNIKGDISN